MTFTFTSPIVPNSDGAPSDHDAVSEGAVMVVSLNDRPVVHGPQIAGTFYPADLATEASALLADDPDAAGHGEAVPAVGCRLCDSARHERSGVQLI